MKFTIKPNWVAVKVETNTKQPSRAEMRMVAMDAAKEEIGRKFCRDGRMSGQAGVWPDNMPKKARKSIIRDLAKNKFKAMREVQSFRAAKQAAKGAGA